MRKCVSLHTFLPEDAGVPGQHGLQQQRGVTLRLIAAQVVLQLSGKKKKTMLEQQQHIRALWKTQAMHSESMGSGRAGRWQTGSPCNHLIWGFND